MVIILAFPVGFWKPILTQQNSNQCLSAELFHACFLISACGRLLEIYVYSFYEFAFLIIRGESVGSDM